MRKSTLILIAIFISLQYSLWFSDGGMITVSHLREKVFAQQEEIKRLAAENEALAAEVTDLKSGVAAIEERARDELGLVKQDETYFLVVKKK